MTQHDRDRQAIEKIEGPGFDKPFLTASQRIAFNSSYQIYTMVTTDANNLILYECIGWYIFHPKVKRKICIPFANISSLLIKKVLFNTVISMQVSEGEKPVFYRLTVFLRGFKKNAVEQEEAQSVINTLKEKTGYEV
ncbi:MAG: hypothetical protein LBR25_07430 [Erysipelotrichaceae bacterium]|jgi:hypothetical protein|nr:hypothetical protein [Erysipelotrichaceae bacterium]